MIKPSKERIDEVFKKYKDSCGDLDLRGFRSAIAELMEEKENDLQKLAFEIQEWSDATFKGNQRTIPILHHLKKEVPELIEALEKLNDVDDNTTDEEVNKLTNQVFNEFADCFMLILDAASHLPMTMDVLINATKKKLEINKKRTWGTPDENGVVEHIEPIN